MRLRRAIPVSLAVLLAAGMAVCAAAGAAGKGAAASKPSASSRPSHPGVKRSRHSRRRQPGQKAPAPERVSEIQQALAKDGSFAGTPNGKWDASTVDAMKKFQVGHGLNPTGKLDAPTLQKLGLGSKTAGVAAPLGSPSSPSRLSSPNSIDLSQQP